MSTQPPIVVKKRRTNYIGLELGYDVTGETFESDIVDADGTVIASWGISVQDAEAGTLLLILDNSITELITETRGWMDVKRVSGGEPIAAFNESLLVLFEEVHTQ